MMKKFTIEGEDVKLRNLLPLNQYSLAMLLSSSLESIEEEELLSLKVYNQEIYLLQVLTVLMVFP